MRRTVVRRFGERDLSHSRRLRHRRRRPFILRLPFRSRLRDHAPCSPCGTMCVCVCMCTRARVRAFPVREHSVVAFAQRVDHRAVHITNGTASPACTRCRRSPQQWRHEKSLGARDAQHRQCNNAPGEPPDDHIQSSLPSSCEKKGDEILKILFLYQERRSP